MIQIPSTQYPVPNELTLGDFGIRVEHRAIRTGQDLYREHVSLEASISLLDDSPIQPTNVDLQTLLETFVVAYPTTEDAKYLAEKSGLASGKYPIRNDMSTTWKALLEVMTRQGKLRTLVETARG